MIEKKLQQKILQFCRKNNILAVKVDSTSTTGWPDLTVIAPGGRVLFVELKTPTGRLSPMQKAIGQELNQKGAEYHVIRSVEAFIELFDG